MNLVGPSQPHCALILGNIYLRDDRGCFHPLHLDISASRPKFVRQRLDAPAGSKFTPSTRNFFGLKGSKLLDNQRLRQPMQIIHLRYQHSLLSQLAAQAAERAKRVRLQEDTPNDVTITTRIKRPDFDLKLEYAKRVAQSAAIAAALAGSIFLYNPEDTLTVGPTNRPAIVMNMQHIPETIQKALPPAPPRCRGWRRRR